MRNVAAVFKKQIRDTLKNKTVLIQFVMFPVFTVIMERSIQIQGMPEDFFVTMFASMYTGMAPMTAMAAIIAEEKEKNTLRVLLMSNVKPWEYLTGVGSYVWLMCMAGAMVFGAVGGYHSWKLAGFLGIMAVGILTSLLVGGAIGAFSKNQMMATSILVPVMMFFSFLPMLSVFNSTASKIGEFTWSGQVSLLLGQTGSLHIGMDNFLSISGNMLAAFGLFTAAYRKSGLA